MVAEWFNTVWGWVVAVAGGVSYSAILTTIICIILKRATAKSGDRQVEISKQVAEETCKTAIKESLGAIKTRVHKHDIEPLVEEKLREVAKISSEVQAKELKEVHEENQKIVKILEKFAVYFDDSFYVSDNAKAELKEAIADAKEEKVELAESEVVEELIEIPTNTEITPQNESQKPTLIER